MLRGSGPCLDSPALLRIVARPGVLRRIALSLLRLKFSPLILPRVRALPLPLGERAALFTQAVSLLSATDSFKTTGIGRTRLADAVVLRLAAGVTSARVAEVGASDGSASLELLAALPKDARLTLTDLTPEYYIQGGFFRRRVLDATGAQIGVRLPGLFLLLPGKRRLPLAGTRRIDTINPLLPETLGITAIIAFSAFTDTLPSPVHVIKCANLLNRAYFPDEIIRAAVDNLRQSLVEGGHLVISQNNARYAGGEAYFVLRRSGADMLLVEEANAHEALELFQQA
jgi:hypothetical protein